MRTSSLLRPRVLGTAGLALLLLGLALPSAGTAFGIGGPSVGTVAGPIEVFTDADVVGGPLGDLLDTELLVENDAAVPVGVFLVGEIAWPGGSSTRLRYGPPQDVPANGAILISATSLIPSGVGAGSGSFTGTAIVTTIGQGGRSGETGALIARDVATFQLP